jgi:hypothetical protein
MTTTVYIDGFNLYYRLLKAQPALKWVNPVALARHVLPKNDVTKVRYFTARVSGRLDPDAPHRQQIYLDALKTLPELEIHYGSFLQVKKYAGLVKPTLIRGKMPLLPWPDVAYVWKTEGKGSDVNIATYLLLDGFQNSYQVAAVLSNDSDLIEPIRVTNNVLKKPVGLLSPVENPQQDLKKAAAFLKHVTLADLAKCQFPDPIVLPNGSLLSKPLSWA